MGWTYVVKINVGATIVSQHKVTDRVGALNGVFVAIEGLQKPRILVGDKFAGLFIGPQLLDASEGIHRETVRYHLQYTRSRDANRCSSAELPSTLRGLFRSCRSGE